MKNLQPFERGGEESTIDACVVGGVAHFDNVSVQIRKERMQVF